ncbi:hypothetical protein ACIRRA_24735 [Nocardia sp. NPDC101769]|uniref:hypothetical protein n=1 Tax=Nocardia sp. NPDC101769 TaxID=3364333 RepID=UPI00381FD56A
MTNNVIRRVAGVVGRLGLAGAMAGGVVLEQHAVARAAETTTFQFPLIEVSQSWGVPMQFTIYLTATVGDQPGVTTFGVATPPPFDGGSMLDSAARIRWVNLTTGASGVIDMGIRETAQQPCDCAPVPVPVFTGAGRIVAAATADGVAVNVSSGLGTFTTP